MTGGTQLGSKYFLGEQIGRGAMGVVYDATTTGGQSLAIKLLRPELASDDKTVARFVQERQIFRRIDHPNVVRVDDLVAEGDQLGIAMEKVEGGDLRQRVETRSLAPSVSMQIAADIAGGLEAIHAAEVVHRDLKPANILLAETPDGLQPKISDFGISRLVSEAMTRTSTTIGTPLYMAPEAADKRGAEAPADIYSLGAMMFELLIGTAPFHEGGTFAVLRAHAQDAPPFIDGVPTELAALIDEMLAKDPAERPDAFSVRQRLIPIIATIDDSQQPVAVERVTGQASDTDATVVVDLPDQNPSDSAETRISSDEVLQQGLAGLAGAGALAGSPNGSPASSNPPVPQAPTMPGAPGQSNPGVFGSAATSNPGGPGAPTVSNAFASQAAGGTIAGGPAPAPAAIKRTGGTTLLDRLPRRSTEIGIAIASLAAVVAVVAFVATRDGGDGTTAIGSAGGPTTQVEGGSGGSTADSGPGSGDDGSGSGPGIFDNVSDDGDGEGGNTTVDGNDGSGGTTPTTDDSSNTTLPATTSTTKPTSSTTAPTTTAPTTTEAPTTTKAPTTTTTWATTTTTRPTTTTTAKPTTTTAPTATPIRIVGGASVDSVGSTSFHFNYSTNDVCGTGSFTVTNVATGVSAGSFSGSNICYGPLHGGFPGHSSFPGFNIEPGTTYRVSVSVRGTASEGGRTAGSGSDSMSFNVTTAG